LQTFWHSSSHVLGEALEFLYGVRLTIGPAVEEGFYYDCYYGSKTLSETDKPAIEKKINEVRFHDEIGTVLYKMRLVLAATLRLVLGV
jgi:threonyl-tRNA synthetase